MSFDGREIFLQPAAGGWRRISLGLAVPRRGSAPYTV